MQTKEGHRGGIVSEHTFEILRLKKICIFGSLFCFSCTDSTLAARCKGREHCRDQMVNKAAEFSHKVLAQWRSYTRARQVNDLAGRSTALAPTCLFLYILYIYY